MKILPIPFAALALAACPAAAQDSGAGPAPAAAAEGTPTPSGEEQAPDEIVVEGEVPKERQRVCTMETTTGSIMPRRVCRTVAQAEEQERVARESLDMMRRDRDRRSFTQMSREQGL